MVTPIVDPGVGTTVTAAGYPVPPIPVLTVVDSVPLVVVSPPGSVSEPVSSPISPLLWSADVASPPSGLAPMDQYLPWRASLPAPLTPRRIIEELVSGSVVASPTGEASVAVTQPRMPL